MMRLRWLKTFNECGIWDKPELQFYDPEFDSWEAVPIVAIEDVREVDNDI